MEFLEREYEPESQRPLLPKYEYTKEDNEKFFNDVEDIADAADARRYKEEARSAMNVAMFKNTARFNETFDRWQKNKDRLKSLKENEIEPSLKFTPDWHKINTTLVWQTSSISFALLCIISGVWPVCLVSLPLVAGLNFKWLLDREGQ